MLLGVLCQVVPQLWAQARQTLLMRGWSAPTASPPQNRAWQGLRLLERSASVAHLVSLVRSRPLVAQTDYLHPIDSCSQSLFSIGLTTSQPTPAASGLMC